MKTLTKPLNQISIYEREKHHGRYLKNRCGRDFLYYALNYYLPDEFSAEKVNPQVIDEQKLFGQPVPAWLAWTQVQFAKVPTFLAKYHLKLFINGERITSYLSFAKAILFSRISFYEAMKKVEEAVDTNCTAGIDISLGFYGLLDHVLFVYGYDAENLYVIDTHKVAGLEYEEVGGENPFFFKLPKTIIKKRWGRFGRIWRVEG